MAGIYNVQILVTVLFITNKVSCLTPEPTTAVPSTTVVPSKICKPEEIDFDRQCRDGNDVTFAKGICTTGMADDAQTQYRKLYEAFRDHKMVDLVVILDRSQSIRCMQFQCAKDLLVRMVNHLVHSGYTAVGPNNMRVAFISFGISVTSDYDGISETTQAQDLHSCNFESKIFDTIYPINGSKIGLALERAINIFTAGRKNRNPDGRRDLKQILFVVSDGESTDEGTGTNGNSSLISGAIKRLHAMDVTRFAIGQDHGWMDTAVREETVISMATDREHYACRYVWSEGLYKQPVPPKSQDTPVLEDLTYVDTGGFNAGDVPQVCLPQHCDKDCVCDIKRIKYLCEDLPRPNGTTVSPYPSQSELPSWLWPVVGAAIGALLLLLILIVICCVCCSRREKQPKSYPGPELPTPPVPRRRRVQPMGYDNIYANAPNGMGNGESKYADPTYQGSAYRDPRFMDSPETAEVYWRGMEENVYQEFEEVEHDLPGWTGFLFEEVHARKFVHLGVHNMRKERWSMSPGLNVLRKEVKEIYKWFTPGAKHRSKTDIKLAGNRYRIQVKDCSQAVQLVATRTVKDKVSQGVHEEMAVVLKEEHYLVVGIANATLKRDLINFCYEISAHFQGLYGTAQTGV